MFFLFFENDTKKYVDLHVVLCVALSNIDDKKHIIDTYWYICPWKESFYHLRLYNRGLRLFVIQSMWNSLMDFLSPKRKTIVLIKGCILHSKENGYSSYKKRAEAHEFKGWSESPFNLRHFQRTKHWYSFWFAGKEQHYIKEGAS